MVPRMKRTDDGGTAIAERPATQERELSGDERIRKFGRTVGAVIRDSVRIGNHTVEGDSEPNHDPSYARAAIRLRRDSDGDVVNANPFEFSSSVDWPGPLVGFLIRDAAGKAIGRANVARTVVAAGSVISAPEGNVIFSPLERER